LKWWWLPTTRACLQPSSSSIRISFCEFIKALSELLCAIIHTNTHQSIYLCIGVYLIRDLGRLDFKLQPLSVAAVANFVDGHYCFPEWVAILASRRRILPECYGRPEILPKIEISPALRGAGNPGTSPRPRRRLRPPGWGRGFV
jgi:hypothetical protein